MQHALGVSHAVTLHVQLTSSHVWPAGHVPVGHVEHPSVHWIVPPQPSDCAPHVVALHGSGMQQSATVTVEGGSSHAIPLTLTFCTQAWTVMVEPTAAPDVVCPVVDCTPTWNFPFVENMGRSVHWPFTSCCILLGVALQVEVTVSAVW
jgi:hypothetical protein